MRAERDDAIHFLGEAGGSAPLFRLTSIESATRTQVVDHTGSGPLRHFVWSLRSRLADCLSRRVVGDLWLMADALLIGASGVLCHIAYDKYYLGVPPNYVAYLYLGAFAASVFFLIAFAVFRLKFRHLADFRAAFSKTLLAFALTVMGLLLLAFVTATSATFSRGSVLAWTASSVLLLLGANSLFAFRVARAPGFRREAVIIGASDMVARFVRHLRDSGARDLHVRALFDEGGERAHWCSLSDLLGVPYRGGLDDLIDYVLEGKPDEVLVALPWHDDRRITRIVDRLCHLPVDVKLCPDRAGYAHRPAYIETVGGALVAAVQARPIRDWGLIFKSMFDVVVSAVLLVALAPLLLLIAALIKLESPGPALFRQKRQGFNHDVFELYKFRTMRHAPNAPFMQARPGDPRVTRVGRWLRRTSLDELPQLINVLHGDMSLVGPRPHPAALNLEFMDQIKRYATRHRVKPGITGWAQVNGWRGVTDTAAKMEGRVSHDLYYIENWSLLLDLKILMLTLFTGFGCKNAH